MNVAVPPPVVDAVDIDDEYGENIHHQEQIYERQHTYVNHTWSLVEDKDKVGGSICGHRMLLFPTAVGRPKPCKGLLLSVTGKVFHGGISGTKASMEGCFGYGGVARRLLPHPLKEEAQRWTNEFQELVELEKSL